MRVIIAGGRDFIATKRHCDWLVEQLKDLDASEVVCGMARGADMFGYRGARYLSLPVAEFLADWKRYGKRAGYVRNTCMAEYATESGRKGACILFPGGRGTQMMREIAAEMGLETREYK